MIEALRLCAVFAVSAGAALWGANRLVRPMSRRAATGLLLLPLALTGRAVATGGFYGPLDLAYVTAPLRATAPPQMREAHEDSILSDLVRQILPWRKAVREAYRHGRFPLWNRFVFAGDILAGSCQPAPLHPFTLIGCLLPLATAWTLGCALTFFLAGLCAFLYLRELDLAELPAFFGAAVWSFSAFLIFWVGWPVGAAFAPLPLLMLGLRRLARGTARGIALTAAALLLTLLAGHPESVLHVAAAAGVVFLFELLANRSRALRAVGASCVAGALAVGISAPALFPYLGAMSQTYEVDLRREIAAREKKSVPFAEAGAASLFALYPTQLADSWLLGGLPGNPKRGLDAVRAGCVGGLALALAALGLASRRRERWVFLGLGLFCFAVVVALPGPTDLLGRLPLFHIALNEYLGGVTALCLAILAAMGLERVLAAEGRRDARVFLAAAALFAGGWLWIRASGLAAKVPGHPVDAGARWLVLAPAAFAACVAIFRGRSRLLGAAALGIFFVTHLAEVPRLYPTFDRKFFFPRIAELDRLPRGGEPYRVVGLGYELVPNLAALYELEDARGYQAMHNTRWLETESFWSAQLDAWFNRVDSPAKPFAAFLNIRYVLADPGTPTPAGLREFVRGPSCAIFENPRALPRAFAPQTVLLAGPKEGVIEEMAPTADFSKIAWVDSDRTVGPAPNGRARVTTREDGPDLLLRIEADARAWIVVSETGWSGWRAREGKREIPLRTGNHAFLAFQVEKGIHEVRLDYHPAGFTAGVWTFAAAVLACVFAAALAKRRGAVEG